MRYTKKRLQSRARTRRLMATQWRPKRHRVKGKRKLLRPRVHIHIDATPLLITTLSYLAAGLDQNQMGMTPLDYERGWKRFFKEYKEKGPYWWLEGEERAKAMEGEK